MKYASVCSGVEAATVAWHPLGWEPVWFSQFDSEHNYKNGPDFPSKVLAHHYPHVPNLGDMLELRKTKTYHDTDFNVLVGGTPCQSFSIAGLRKGLDDERGNLALEFVRILNDKRPQWFIWENVPGVLSSGSEKDGGDEGTEEDEEESGNSSDFACILSAFTGRDVADQKFSKAGIITGEFYSIAWRILDSQHFGVPQRRRRLFVVGHLGNDWRPPVAVLFERDSLRRDFTPSREERKGTTGATEGGLGAEGFRMCAFGEYSGDNSASTIKKRDHKDATDLIVQSGYETYSYQNQQNGIVQSDVASTIFQNSGSTDERSVPCYVAYGIKATAIGREPENGGNGLGFKEEQADTLTKMDRHAVCNKQPPLSFNWQEGRNFKVTETSNPLIKNQTEAVIYRPPLILKIRGGKDGGGKGYLGSDKTAFTVTTLQDQNLFTGLMVRRLTPMECERLQGFPDSYTDIPMDDSKQFFVEGEDGVLKKRAPDGKRYQSMGNSMTTYVMHWLGLRIDMFESTKT